MKTLYIIMFFSLFLVTSCTSDQFVTNNKQENGKVSIDLDKQNAPKDVTEVVATFSRENHSKIIQSLTLADSSTAGILIENLDVGLWHVLVEALNNENKVIYSGETEIRIEANVITPIHIQLNPVSGGVFLSVTWGNTIPLNESLIGYFPFDNDVNDYSKYHNNGSFNFGDFTSGIIGKALQFDGVNSFVEIPHKDFYNSDEKTVMFWFYKNNDFIRDTPGLVDAEGLLFKSWDTGLDRDISISISNQIPPFDIYAKIGNGTNSLLEVRTSNFIQPRRWYHVAVMIDKQNVKLYLNGQLTAKTPFSGRIVHNNSPIIVGKASVYSHSTRYFNGKIDDLRIYNKTFDESDIIKIISQLKTNIGLVAFYPFWGSPVDLSGNQNNGFVYGPTLTNDRFDKESSAYYFDGVDDYIVIKDNNSLSPKNQQLTITTWVKVLEEGNKFILYKGTNPYNREYAIGIRNDMRASFQINNHGQAGIGQIGVPSESVIQLDKWYFIASTWNGNELKIYINGQLENTLKTNVVVDNLDSDLYLGTYGGSISQYAAKTIIDDLAIFNRELSQIEIEGLYLKSK